MALRFSFNISPRILNKQFIETDVSLMVNYNSGIQEESLAISTSPVIENFKSVAFGCLIFKQERQGRGIILYCILSPEEPLLFNPNA